MGEAAKEIFVALVVNFPWLLDVIQWLSVGTNIWHSIESLVVLGGLWLVHRRLKGVSGQLHKDGQRMEQLVTGLNGTVENLSENLRSLDEKVDERADTVTQLVNAAREAAETMQVATTAQAASNGSIAHWEQLRSMWQEMRSRIELAIERIKHKNVRTKYSKIDRYSYYDVITTLRADDEINSQVAMALLNMNRSYLKLRSRPAQVTSADVVQFQRWNNQVNGALPKQLRADPERTPPPAVPGSCRVTKRLHHRQCSLAAPDAKPFSLQVQPKAAGLPIAGYPLAYPQNSRHTGF